MNLRFRSLQNRILFFFLGLFVIVQMLAFLAVNTAGTQNAHAQIRENLLSGGKVFDRLIRARTDHLFSAARVLSGDYGFKSTFADGDRPTLLSAMYNHAARINADVMLLVTPDRVLLADTLHPAAPPAKFPFRRLIRDAERNGEASAPVFLDGRLYQIVVVPLLAPEPVAWICTGFLIGDTLARDLQRLTDLDVTFVRASGGRPEIVVASTLPADQRQALDDVLRSALPDREGALVMELRGERYMSLALDIGGMSDLSVKVYLQRSVEKAIKPFLRLRKNLIILFILGLCITMVGGVLISATVTRPVRLLAESVRSIERGDYTRTVQTGQRDELGRLASAFNLMAEAIAQREDRIAFQAYHDILTGLPNRSFLHLRLNEAIAASTDGRPVALILINIARFNDVNAALGHATGDLILQQIGPLLQRAVDGAAVMARMGGDEFAVILAGEDAEGAVRVAQKIAKELESPFRIEEAMVQIEARFGIAVFPAHGADASMLLRHANAGLHRAKALPGGISVYSEELDRYSRRQLNLLGDLRRALEQDELVLFYQPKVRFDSGRITSVEALARWKHPQRGLIMPDEFIPLLEGTGLIRPLTLWTLRAAVDQCAAFGRDGVALTVAVNLSARMLPDLQLPALVSSLLAERQVPPQRIILEVTESAIMTDPARTLDIISELASLGVKLSVDDFGTGYSSLSYLQKLPVDEIKIDKSFVQHMDTSLNDAALVRSIIEMAHNLNLSVTAEGVENRRIWDLLKARGCDLAQGYLMSRPLPVDELMRWMRESPWGAEQQS